MWSRHVCVLSSLLCAGQILTLWARLGLNTKLKHLQAARGMTLTQWSHLQTASACTAVRCCWLIGSTNIKQEGVWSVTHCVFKYVYFWMRRGRVIPLSLNPKGSNNSKGHFSSLFLFFFAMNYVYKVHKCKRQFCSYIHTDKFQEKRRHIIHVVELGGLACSSVISVLLFCEVMVPQL